METLSNSILTVQIAEHGAELQSIKKDGKEYLWQGDAKFWGRRRAIRGVITKHNPGCAKAGTWKVMDLPPPVGINPSVS